MSIRIYCNSKEILHIKNSIFGSIHDTVMEIVEEENIQLSSSMAVLLRKTDQNVYGSGCVGADIANFITKKDDSKLLADLIGRAIEIENKKYPFFSSTLEKLWNFHAEILKYAETLKTE